MSAGDNSARGYLVKKRLKKMMVAPINENNL